MKTRVERLARRRRALGGRTGLAAMPPKERLRAEAVIRRTLSRATTDASLQALMGANKEALIADAAVVFAVCGFAGQAAGRGDSPEVRIIAGAAGALADLGEGRLHLQDARQAINQGLLAAARLRPTLPMQAVEGAITYATQIFSPTAAR